MPAGYVTVDLHNRNMSYLEVKNQTFCEEPRDSFLMIISTASANACIAPPFLQGRGPGISM